MNLAPDIQKVADAMPAALRALLVAELAAGNAVVEISSGFPAPPVGACVKLAHPLRSRPRASGDGITYYNRNNSEYSGEITDAKRFYFLLEPPNPPEPEPDMDAIRAKLRASQDEALMKLVMREAREPQAVVAEELERLLAEAPTPDRGSPKSGGSLFERFRESMVMNYERWREGTSYALDLIEQATPEDRRSIETMLVTRGVRDWRDVEALAALDTPRARELLRDTVERGSAEFAEAVARYAPHVLAEGERTRVLVAALEFCDVYGGLTQALLHVQEHHPRAVHEALWRGILARTGQHAYQFAAMLLFLHGRISSPHDWSERPFLLRFVTDDRRERETVFRELCARLGEDPEIYLRHG